MDIKEWVDGLRRLSPEQIVQAHIGLQEQIKKHYKLRAVGSNLKKATHLCEQMVALAELAYPALEEMHYKRVSEHESVLGQKHPDPEYYRPTHHGYRQLITIMKKRKDMGRVEGLEAKRDAEGWRS